MLEASSLTLAAAAAPVFGGIRSVPVMRSAVSDVVLYVLLEGVLYTLLDVLQDLYSTTLCVASHDAAMLHVFLLHVNSFSVAC